MQSTDFIGIRSSETNASVRSGSSMSAASISNTSSLIENSFSKDQTFAKRGFKQEFNDALDQQQHLKDTHRNHRSDSHSESSKKNVISARGDNRSDVVRSSDSAPEQTDNAASSGEAGQRVTHEPGTQSHEQSAEISRQRRGEHNSAGAPEPSNASTLIKEEGVVEAGSQVEYGEIEALEAFVPLNLNSTLSPIVGEEGGARYFDGRNLSDRLLTQTPSSLPSSSVETAVLNPQANLSITNVSLNGALTQQVNADGRNLNAGASPVASTGIDSNVTNTTSMNTVSPTQMITSSELDLTMTRNSYFNHLSNVGNTSTSGGGPFGFSLQNSSSAAVEGEHALSSSIMSNSASPIASAQLGSGDVQGVSQLQNSRFSVNIQFGRMGWNDGIANQVAQMAAKNLNFAEIQLDPPELGPLQVRIHVSQDQASVAFSTHSQQVKDALEHGQSRLRELFDSEGLELVDVDVSDQQQQGEDELDSEHTGEKQLAVDASGEDEGSHHADEADKLVSSVLEVGVDDFV